MYYRITLFWTLLLTFAINLSPSSAQSSWKWIDVITEGHINGRVKQDDITAYQRLPEAMEEDVRDPLWYLGTHSAGLHIKFKTKADRIQVRYGVKHALEMPHMPATGVSGVDLYAHDAGKDEWYWASGHYTFKDTVTYFFDALEDGADKIYELYLPLYNTVSWMEIGVSDSQSLEFLSETEAPVIVYGTSIAQGACASRPGLAWTNILHRAIEAPVVNLGFSGNGRLEGPLIELIAATPAKAIVLDCLPNLSVTPERSVQQLDSLIYSAVLTVREKQPQTPIILTEHSSGFDPHIMNSNYNQQFQESTQVLRQTMHKMRKEGVANIYMLTNEEIGLDINATVDYVHPNDWGMLKIAEAYKKIFDKIF